MRRSMGIVLLTLIIVCIKVGAATMPNIVVTNKSDSIVQILAIDNAHKAPVPLDQMSVALPPGALILTNKTGTPINAVVVLWSYVDKEGKTLEKRFNCDGYISGGVPEPIVQANDSALITPGGCTRREYFAHMAAGKPMLGGSLQTARNKEVSDVADTFTSVRITVDSVIFSNGNIWGPDAKQYYKTVSANYWATRSVVDEVSAAKVSGQDVKATLERILGESSGAGGYRTHLRKLCASNIHDSPNPDVTLKFYSDNPPLPTFQHLGGEIK